MKKQWRVVLMEDEKDKNKELAQLLKQVNFFIGDLAQRKPCKYWCRTRGLRNSEGAGLLFQFEGCIIASAYLIKCENEVDEKGEKHPVLYLEPDSIRIFKPITPQELQRVIPEFKQLNQTPHNFMLEDDTELKKLLDRSIDGKFSKA